MNAIHRTRVVEEGVGQGRSAVLGPNGVQRTARDGPPQARVASTVAVYWAGAP